MHIFRKIRGLIPGVWKLLYLLGTLIEMSYWNSETRPELSKKKFGATEAQQKWYWRINAQGEYMFGFWKTLDVGE